MKTGPTELRSNASHSESCFNCLVDGVVTNYYQLTESY